MWNSPLEKTDVPSNMPPKRSDTRSIGLVYFHKANESVKPIDVSIIQTYVTESEELYNAILQNVPAPQNTLL